jgi:hypothetical protein
LKSKLSDWARIAEILAAIAVIISLLIVAFQISEGNRETRAMTALVVLEGEKSVQSEFLRYAGIWEKVVSGEPLEAGEELRRGIILYNMMHTQEESRYHQIKSGFLQEGGEGILESVAWPMGSRPVDI